MVDKGDITQMGEAASKEDKEGMTQDGVEVKEGTEVGMVAKEVREDTIQGKTGALGVKGVIIQEAAKVDREAKEVTTLVTMDSGEVVVKEDKVDKEGTTQEETEVARADTIREEMVTTMEKGEVVTIQVDLRMMRRTLEKRSTGRSSAQLSEVQRFWQSLHIYGISFSQPFLLVVAVVVVAVMVVGGICVVKRRYREVSQSDL